MTDFTSLSNVKISENTQQSDEKKQKFTFEKSDGIFAVLFFVLSYLYVQWTYPFRPALSTALFVLLFVIIGTVYGKACGFNQSRKSIPYLAILLLGAVRFVVFDNDLPGVMLYMFITFMAVYWVGVFAKRRIGADKGKDYISSLFVWDIFNQLLNVPFSHFSCAFGSIKSSFGKGRNSSTSGQILIGILICIPVAFVVISLLASADTAFDNLMGILYEMFFGKIYSSVIRFFIAIPVWCYFFGLFYGNLRNRSFKGITAENVQNARKYMCKMPKATAYTVLTIINLIYILFFVSQSAYLFSGFSNLLPDEFTYSPVSYTHLVLIKGNHDYWWSSVSRLNGLYAKSGMYFLQNDCFMLSDGKTAVCGARLWKRDSTEAEDIKIYRREIIRAKLSFDAAVRKKCQQIIFMSHYPPLLFNETGSEICELFKNYPVIKAVYGHLHGNDNFKTGFQGVIGQTEYKLVSADYVNFMPQLIFEED